MIEVQLCVSVKMVKISHVCVSLRIGCYVWLLGSSAWGLGSSLTVYHMMPYCQMQCILGRHHIICTAQDIQMAVIAVSRRCGGASSVRACQKEKGLCVFWGSD